jgi:hypothetical protein
VGLEQQRHVQIWRWAADEVVPFNDGWRGAGMQAKRAETDAGGKKRGPIQYVGHPSNGGNKPGKLRWNKCPCFNK